MKKHQLEQYCREHAGQALTPEARNYLEKNRELSREVDQLIAMQSLISLKKYEHPDPDAVARCQAGVQDRIAAHRQASVWSRLREWFYLHEQAPVPAYAAIALIVFSLGSFVLYSVGRTADAPMLAEERSSELSPVVVAEVPRETNQVSAEMVADIPASEKPIIVLKVDRTAEATSGSPVTFGGDQSVPVSYEP